MYDAFADPYCYKGTLVLKNRLGLRDQTLLDLFEAEATAQRFLEPLPVGQFDVRHYRAVRRHIFSGVYRWAGQFRTVRISKGGSAFCYPEHICAEMDRVFGEFLAADCLQGAQRDAFVAGVSHLLAELNAVHPFRDGNGRAQLAFLALIADTAGRTLHLDRLIPERFLAAMIESFYGREQALVEQIDGLL